MKFLEENIEVTVNNINVPSTKTYVYKVYKGNDVIFIGNVFLEAGTTSKTFDITDIISNYAYINGVSTDIIVNCKVELVIDQTTLVSNTEQVYLAYRYPHYLKRLQIEKDNNYITIQPGLLPTYPKVNSEEYKINTTFLRNVPATDYSKVDKALIYKQGDTIGLNVVSTSKDKVESVNTDLNSLYSSDFNLIFSTTSTEITTIGENNFTAPRTIATTIDVRKQEQSGILRTIDTVTASVQPAHYEYVESDVSSFILYLGSSVNSIKLSTEEIRRLPLAGISYKFSFDLRLIASTSGPSVQMYNLKMVPYYEEDGIYLTVGAETRTPILQRFTLFNEKVANICDYSDGYYLQWQDRLGGIQSQHFDKVNTFSNSYNRDTITNYKGYKRPIYNEVTSKWVINSNWINEEFYPNYESILVSPFLRLYDIKEDKVYDVVVTDNGFTEKTFHNQGRQMFNLQLNLEKANKQNILY